MSTLFSRIVAREVPSFGVAESDQFYAFLDIRPINPGHVLVVPKIEVDELFDLDNEWLQGLMPFAKPLASALKRVTGRRVGVLVAGFEVPHAHVHLIPITSEADLDFSRAKSAHTAELERMQGRIIEALAVPEPSPGRPD